MSWRFYQDVEDQNAFHFVEEWKTQADLERHLESEHRLRQRGTRVALTSSFSKLYCVVGVLATGLALTPAPVTLAAETPKEAETDEAVAIEQSDGEKATREVPDQSDAENLPFLNKYSSSLKLSASGIFGELGESPFFPFSSGLPEYQPVAGSLFEPYGSSPTAQGETGGGEGQAGAKASETREQQQPGGEKKEMGADPRDFSPKFMPYYRHTELEFGLAQDELVLFGLMPLTKKIAFTYEFPLAYNRDITNTALCAGLPATPCGGTIPGGGPVLPSGLPAEGDGREVGIGDGNIRFLGAVGHTLGGDWMLAVEFDLPTATDPVLGSESFIVAPGVVYAKNLGFWPGPAFFASMNFYAFDAWKDASRADVSQYRGRWFFMLPLHPSGIYALPELQPVYDFENGDFSFWIGPEFGKMLAPGQILYVKPGFGIGNAANSSDRKWSLEIGYRFFLN